MAVFQENFSVEKRVLAELRKYIAVATTQSIQAAAMQGHLAGGFLRNFDGHLDQMTPELMRAISSELVREIPTKRSAYAPGNFEFVLPPPGFDVPCRRNGAQSPGYPFLPSDQGTRLVDYSEQPPIYRSDASQVDANSLTGNALLHLFQSRSMWSTETPRCDKERRTDETDSSWSLVTHGSSGESGNERVSPSFPGAIDCVKPQPNAVPSQKSGTKSSRKAPSQSARNSEDNEEQALASGVKVFIGNVMPTTTEEELYEIFRSFGECSGLVLLRDRRQRPRGAGFVTFKRKEDADKAMDALDRKFCVKGAVKPLEVRPPENSEQKRERIRLLAQMRSQMNRDLNVEADTRDSSAQPSPQETGKSVSPRPVSGELGRRRRRRGHCKTHARAEKSCETQLCPSVESVCSAFRRENGALDTKSLSALYSPFQRALREGQPDEREESQVLFASRQERPGSTGDRRCSSSTRCSDCVMAGLHSSAVCQKQVNSFSRLIACYGNVAETRPAPLVGVPSRAASPPLHEDLGEHELWTDRVAAAEVQAAFLRSLVSCAERGIALPFGEDPARCRAHSGVRTCHTENNPDFFLESHRGMHLTEPRNGAHGERPGCVPRLPEHTPAQFGGFPSLLQNGVIAEAVLDMLNLLAKEESARNAYPNL
uniref:RNA recognition motif-containing protein n=1 Tax=Toxoplasma gondii COUG TaxID=1074873 RepID=A0A2G8Y8Y2_TOXGO|nr:RNA recognition motif-containing protein [Toxoplasma gondii COUG]